MREIEIKLKVPDMDAIIAKLHALGCALSDPKTQKDQNFVHKDDTKWFESTGGEWIYPRLRAENDKALTFTVKKPVKNEMDCIEHELHVDNAEELKAIMKMFGYIEGVTVRKTRRTCVFEKYTITLDEVDHLGNFMEIEQMVTEGDSEKIQTEMFRFVKDMFDLEKDERIMKGYDILLHNFQSRT